MKTYRLTISTQTAFGTPILGETLFGSLCWAVVHESGEDRLAELLAGYAEGKPFAVISDAFPAGYVPLPALPASVWEVKAGDDRKYLKKKAWVPVADVKKNPLQWRDRALTESELSGKLPAPVGIRAQSVAFKAEGVVTHNTINRATGTTGEGAFAPFQQTTVRFHPNLMLDVYAVIDEARFTKEELVKAMSYVGLSGYGRDASAGLGKFVVTGVEACSEEPASCSRLTLASAALGGLKQVIAEATFYRTKTHFGRHGSQLAVSGAPFKKPVLLAQAGTVVTFDAPQADAFLGRGITGISMAAPEAVHQGYSPVLALPDLTEVLKK